MSSTRPVALVTGVGREIGIAAGIVERLAADGWDIAMSYWSPYDQRMPWGNLPNSVAAIEQRARDQGASVLSVEADLSSVDTPAALDRIVIAAATELAGQGITANLINPGPIDTGWMTPELAEELAAKTPAGRLGKPRDTGALVSFLLSADGGWISGQLLKSDGGFSAPY